MTTENITALLMAALALLFSFSTVLFSMLAYCNVIGLKNSTHNIQYMPAEEFDKFGKEDEDDEDDEEEDMGMPMARKKIDKKEKRREKELLEGFAEMYKDPEE